MRQARLKIFRWGVDVVLGFSGCGFVVVRVVLVASERVFVGVTGGVVCWQVGCVGMMYFLGYYCWRIFWGPKISYRV